MVFDAQILSVADCLFSKNWKLWIVYILLDLKFLSSDLDFKIPIIHINDGANKNFFCMYSTCNYISHTLFGTSCEKQFLRDTLKAHLPWIGYILLIRKEKTEKELCIFNDQGKTIRIKAAQSIQGARKKNHFQEVSNNSQICLL